jgi:hypothetical protein
VSAFLVPAVNITDIWRRLIYMTLLPLGHSRLIIFTLAPVSRNYTRFDIDKISTLGATDRTRTQAAAALSAQRRLLSLNGSHDSEDYTRPNRGWLGFVFKPHRR